MNNFFVTFYNRITDFLKTQSFPSATEWKNLVSWEYWSNSYPPATSEFYLFVGFAIYFSIIALIVWVIILKRKNKVIPVYEGLISHLINIIVMMAIIFPAYYFFRIQQIAYLSSQLVMLGTIFVIVVWFAWIFKIIYLEIPQKRRVHLEKQRFFRYLPKSRKKE